MLTLVEFMHQGGREGERGRGVNEAKNGNKCNESASINISTGSTSARSARMNISTIIVKQAVHTTLGLAEKAVELADM